MCRHIQRLRGLPDTHLLTELEGFDEMVDPDTSGIGGIGTLQQAVLHELLELAVVGEIELGSHQWIFSPGIAFNSSAVTVVGSPATSFNASRKFRSIAPRVFIP